MSRNPPAGGFNAICPGFGIMRKGGPPLSGSEDRQIAPGGVIQTFTVVLIPDLEDGGYTVQCQEIPGAISEGDTEQEALDNIIEVLEEVLEFEKDKQAQALVLSLSACEK